MLIHLLTSALFASVTLMLMFPRTPTAKAIRHVLVETPAGFLSDLTWARAGQVALSLTALAIMLMTPEMALLLAAMGADAALVEVMIIVWVASVSGGWVSAWQSARQAGAGAIRIMRRAGRAASRPRARRDRSKTGPRGRKEDADGPELAYA